MLTWGAVWWRSIGNYFEHFLGFSEYGIINQQENKALKIK